MYLGLSFSATETARATKALELASGVVEEHLGRTLASVRQTEIVATGGSSARTLNRWPVTEVHSVTQAGLVIDTTAYRWHDHGVIERLFGGWVGAVAVDYTAGYVQLPASIKQAVLMVARNDWEAAYPRTFAPNLEGNPPFARSSPGPRANEDWKKILTRFRSPAVA